MRAVSTPDGLPPEQRLAHMGDPSPAQVTTARKNRANSCKLLVSQICTVALSSTCSRTRLLLPRSLSHREKRTLSMEAAACELIFSAIAGCLPLSLMRALPLSATGASWSVTGAGSSLSGAIEIGSEALRFLLRKPVEKRRAALLPHVPTVRVEVVATGPSA